MDPALTNEVTRPRIFAPDLWRISKCITQSDEQVRPAFESVHDVCFRHLQSLGHCLHCELAKPSCIDLAGVFWVAAEHAGLEHLQTGDRETLAPFVKPAALFALVLPSSTCSCVEKDGDQEEVDQTSATFLCVYGDWPCLHELVHTWTSTDFKVLPAAVGWNRGKVWRIVSLCRRSAQFDTYPSC